MNDLLKAVILGVVEGVTEFLPISSTGHLLLCGRWMGIDLKTDPFWKMFIIVIQFGAILSVLVYFARRIVDLLARALAAGPAGRRPLYLIIAGTLPVLLIGFVLKDWVDANMEKPWIIVAAIGLGGVLMILAEHLRPASRTETFEQMSWPQAILVGLAQVLAAIFPGTSRSAATIIGGLFAGLSRTAAAEFSFFLAIPAMAAASGYRLLKDYKSLTHNTAHLDASPYLVLLVGCAVSFLVAWASIAFLMRIIRTHSFTPFALYRILLALAVAAVLLS
jgi:undecaprenyl-diphosphatase